jgi:hypothetical protein
LWCSRGHKDDFAALKAANVDLKGKLALAKYGGPFRGVKVQNAEKNGMVGVVMFSDPGDDTAQVAKGQKAYPGMLASHTIKPRVVFEYANIDQTAQLASLPQFSADLLPLSTNTPVIPPLLATRQSPALSASTALRICRRSRHSRSPTVMRSLYSRHWMDMARLGKQSRETDGSAASTQRTALDQLRT